VTSNAYHSEGVAELVLELIPDGSTAIDVGAYHWGWLSNTWLLERVGWDVYCIEANPNCAEFLEPRENVYYFAAGSENQNDVDFYIYTHPTQHDTPREASFTSLLYKGDVGFLMETIKVDVRTLDWFMGDIGLEQLDFLSVDTEGTELDVLDGLDLNKWQPTVISVEAYFGATHEEQAAYLKEYGYHQVEILIHNGVYIYEP